MFSALWNYRGFVLASVKREFEARYRVSLLGGLWAILNPLAQIAVYTVVLAGIMRAKLPGLDNTFAYSIYLCAGIITWSLFADIIGRTTVVFVENANLLKKVSFPRICLAANALAASILNFTIIFSLFLGFLLITGNFPGWPLLGVLPLIAIQTLLAAGLGVLLGVANVFFRDIAQGVGIAMQFWFWLTPIVYPLAIVPEQFHALIEANPATPIAAGYHRILLEHQWPDWSSLLPAVAIAALAVVAGIHFFRKRSSEMVDEL